MRERRWLDLHGRIAFAAAQRERLEGAGALLRAVIAEHLADLPPLQPSIDAQRK